MYRPKPNDRDSVAVKDFVLEVVVVGELEEVGVDMMIIYDWLVFCFAIVKVLDDGIKTKK